MFNLERAIEILERTPEGLIGLLNGLSDEWIMTNEGGETFSPFDVVGHLVHCEKTDWIVRLEIILSDKEDKTFLPVDRFAQLRDNRSKSLVEILNEFKALRQRNIATLKSKELSEADFKKTGTHPSLGTVTLQELIATWVVHDLNHIAQIVRVMAKQYKHEVGPWHSYLRLLSI